MISKETLEAEIAELKSEVNRRVSAVRGLFAEVAGLKTEIDLLNRIVAVREANSQSDTLSMILLGFAATETGEASALCAVTWSGSREQPSDLRILVKHGWQSALPEWVLQYFTDLLSDWRRLVQSQPSMVLSLINELSVGPLRVMQESKMGEEMVTALLREMLGEADPMPSLSIIK